MDDLANIPDLKYVHDLEHVLDDKNTFLILKLIKLISVPLRSVPIFLSAFFAFSSFFGKI